MPSFSLKVCSLQIYFAPGSKLSRHALYILHALPTCFFDDVKQNLGSQKAGPVRLELETNEVERVSVSALFLCFSVRCEGLFWPIQFLGPKMIGKPCVGRAKQAQKPDIMSGTHWCPRTSQNLCQKKMAIREYHQQLLMLILIILSQQAWQHHGEEKAMVGPATPRKIPAFAISMNFYIATISGARSFAI